VIRLTGTRTSRNFMEISEIIDPLSEEFEVWEKY